MLYQSNRQTSNTVKMTQINTILSPFISQETACLLGSNDCTNHGSILWPYMLSNFEIDCNVMHGKLPASLQVTIKRACFTTIPYTTHAFYGNSLEIRNDMSNLKVGQTVAAEAGILV